MYSIRYTLLVLCFRSALTMSNNNPFPADLNINTWTEPGCDKATGVKTTVSLNNSLAYSMMWSIGRPVQSYMLNRTLQSWERLDWSSPYANDATPEGGAIPEGCGNYLQTTNPDSNGHMLQGGICYPIIDGATCVNIWNTSCAPVYDAKTGYANICAT